MKSPKGLIEIERGKMPLKWVSPTVAKIAPSASFQNQLEENISRLRDIFCRQITEGGFDPAQYRNIAKGGDEAKPAVVAAMMLHSLDHMQSYLRTVESTGNPAAITAARGAVLSALSFAGLYHNFTIVDHETAIAAQESRSTGGSIGGTAKSRKFPSRDREMAEKYLEARRDPSKGAISGSQLKFNIGKGYGFKSRSGAIAAINHALSNRPRS